MLDPGPGNSRGTACENHRMSEAPPGPQDAAPEPPESAEPARSTERTSRAGHSPEHACLVDHDRRILIAGDQVLPKISSNVSLHMSQPGEDPLGDWLESIAKFRRLPDDLLVLPGHGDPFYGLYARLDALDREHRERLDALVDFMDEPRRGVDCFPKLFRRPIGPDVIGMATGEALAHLRHLEVTGRAVRETRDGVWWWRRA